MKKTIENNKLIAEFMGLPTRISKGTTYYGICDEISEMQSIGEWAGISVIENEDTPEEKTLYGQSIDELKYHTSWDWLIPVVEKIEKQLDENNYHLIVKIENTYCSILKEDGEEIIGFAEKNKLEATYKAVAEFIKWYNKNK